MNVARRTCGYIGNNFGIIKYITDHNYITNSYHVNVREDINPFEKLKIESKFQRLSPGGAVSYIESSDMSKNLSALMSIVKYIYQTMVYAEVNTKSDCLVFSCVLIYHYIFINSPNVSFSSTGLADILPRLAGLRPNSVIIR